MGPTARSGGKGYALATRFWGSSFPTRLPLKPRQVCHGHIPPVDFPPDARCRRTPDRRSLGADIRGWAAL